jgi:hypothetical protein
MPTYTMQDRSDLHQQSIDRRELSQHRERSVTAQSRDVMQRGLSTAS